MPFGLFRRWCQCWNSRQPARVLSARRTRHIETLKRWPLTARRRTEFRLWLEALEQRLAAATLVNPIFETGDLTGWTSNGQVSAVTSHMTQPAPSVNMVTVHAQDDHRECRLPPRLRCAW